MFIRTKHIQFFDFLFPCFTDSHRIKQKKEEDVYEITINITIINSKNILEINNKFRKEEIFGILFFYMPKISRIRIYRFQLHSGILENFY